MADRYTDELPLELAGARPAPPGNPDLKFSWPAFEVPREYFDRRDDSVGKRKHCRHLDTFREVAPDDRDVQRLAERFGARYIMLPFCIGGVQQTGKTLWREVMADARVIGEQPASAATPARTPADDPLLAHIRRLERMVSGRGARPQFGNPRRRGRPRDRGEASAAQLLQQQMQQQIAREQQIADERLQREREYNERMREMERAAQEREREATHERLERLEAGKGNPATADPLGGLLGQILVAKIQAGDEDTTDRLIERVLGGDEEKQGGGVVDTVLELLRNPEALRETVGAVGPYLPLLFGRGAAPQQPQQPANVAHAQQPAPAQQQQPAVEGEGALTLEGVIENIVDDIQQGRSSRDAVGDVIKLRTGNPHLAPQVDALLATSNDELIGMIRQAGGVDLSDLKNTRPYLDKLREGVRARLQPPPPAPVNGSSNGAGAAQAAGV